MSATRHTAPQFAERRSWVLVSPAGVERTQAPRAHSTADLPPPERPPEIVPGSLNFSDNPNPMNQ